MNINILYGFKKILFRKSIFFISVLFLAVFSLAISANFLLAETADAPYLNAWIDTIPIASTYVSPATISGTKSAGVASNYSFPVLNFYLYKISSTSAIYDTVNYYSSDIVNLTLVSGSEGKKWSGTFNTANLASGNYEFYAKGWYNSMEYVSNYVYFAVENTNTIISTPTPTIIPASNLTFTITPTPTLMPIPTPTLVLTPTSTPTSISILTPTPAPTITSTSNLTPTSTPIPTYTPIPTLMPKIIPTSDPAVTLTPTPITNSTSTVTTIPTPTPTSTPTLTSTPTITPVLTLTPAITPSFGIKVWIEGIPTNIASATAISDIKKVYAYSYNFDSSLFLTGLDFRLYNRAAQTYTIYAPIATSIDGNQNWSGVLDVTKLKNGDYDFSARGWYNYNGVNIYYKSNVISINVSNNLITPVPSLIPSVASAEVSPAPTKLMEPPPIPTIVISQECKDKGFLTEEECRKYFIIPLQCRQQNILDDIKCKEYMFKYAMPQECRDQKAETQEQCSWIILSKILPEECRRANIASAEECGKFLSIQARLTIECRNSNIMDIEECDEYMFENFMPKDCLEQGAKSKEECDYILRSKYEKLEDAARIEIKRDTIKDTSNLFKECQEAGISNPEDCEKFVLAKKLPEECRQMNVATKEDCEKALFKKYAPQECVKAEIYDMKECEKLIFKMNAPSDCLESGILTPEACKKYMFDKYGSAENIPTDNFPIECKKTGVKSADECEKLMKAKYLPDECKSQGITDADLCGIYLKKKYMPQECQDDGAASMSECDKIMFKKYAPAECEKAGIENEKECKDFMFNLYAPKAACANLDEWQCKNTIKEKHLGNIVATQVKFNKIKEEAVLLAGKSIKSEELEEKIGESAKIISLEGKELGFKVVAAKENLVLNEKNDLIQTASVALMIDSDKDGLPDDMEKRLGTDPNNADTDGDGYTDGEEVKNGYDPVGSGDLKEKMSPVEEAIMQNKTLSQPKAEGEESGNLAIYKIDNAETYKDQPEENKGYAFSGKADPDAIVALYIYSDLPLVVTVKTDKFGNWKYELDKSLVDGDHEAYVALNDNTGKILAKSKPLNFFVKEAKAVSVKDFISPGDAGTANESEKAIYYYAVMAIMLTIIGIMLFMIFLIQRKKQISKF